MKKLNERRIIFINALLTGFFGGVLIALIHIVFNYFNISKVNYEKVLALFHIQGAWIEKWYGYFFFVFFIGGLSILIALIYYLLLKGFRSWVPGALFGIVLWLVFGLLIPFQLYELTFASFYKSYTNVLSFCSLLLYGMFVGYSISYDEEMRKYDPQNS